MARTISPVAPVSLGDAEAHRRRIADRANACLPKNGGENMTAPFPLAQFTVETLPAASDWGGCLVYVTNASGGATPAWSDGTNWKRIYDGATVS